MKKQKILCLGLATLLLSGGASAVSPTNMVFVEGGTFTMGDTWGDGRENERPVHEVTLDSFEMSECEITVEEMARVMNWSYEAGKIERAKGGRVVRTSESKEVLFGKYSSLCWADGRLLPRKIKRGVVLPLFENSKVTSSGSKSILSETVVLPLLENSKVTLHKHPFERASWVGAAVYCNFRSEMERLTPCYRLKKGEWECDFTATGYRLPTEAEWEYAARGGSIGQNTKYSGSNIANDVAWHRDNSILRVSLFTGYKMLPDKVRFEFTTQNVGTKQPNELGLFDMSGNAMEWCNDWVCEYESHSQVSPDGGSKPRGSKKSLRVQRGGGRLRDTIADCRVTTRVGGSPEDSLAGFRIVRNVLREPAPLKKKPSNIAVTTSNSSFENAELSKLVLIKGGSFSMGDSRGDESERPEFLVTLDSFEISSCEITQVQLVKVMNWALKKEKIKVRKVRPEKVSQTKRIFILATGKTQEKKYMGYEWPLERWVACSFDAKHLPLISLVEFEYQEVVLCWDGEKLRVGDRSLNYPCENVTWNGAVRYCNFRSEMEGLTQCYQLKKKRWVCDFRANGYRLPTEAEWEYAARGGASETDTKYSGGNVLAEQGWYEGNNGGEIAAREITIRGIPDESDPRFEEVRVGTKMNNAGEKAPNELGLFDMSGGAMEWCNDWYGEYEAGSKTNPVGPERPGGKKDPFRVQRGGSWESPAEGCRVTARSKGRAKEDMAGFRVVRSVLPKEELAQEK